MNKTQAKFYFDLQKAGNLGYTRIPLIVHEHDSFHMLRHQEILQIQPQGRGKRIIVAKPEEYKKFLQSNFPQGDPTGIHAPQNTIQSHAKYGNSKTAKGASKDLIIFLRGNDVIHVNDQAVNLAYHTQHFGTFACVIENLRVPKLCFVENKDVFLQAEAIAEAIIPKGYTFMHTYGRVGKNLIKKLEALEILTLVDYDYVGLGEYLSFKQYFPNTRLPMPENYDQLYDDYKRPLSNKKKSSQQRAQDRVKESKDPIVQKIFQQLRDKSFFLEQQVLLHHAS